MTKKAAADHVPDAGWRRTARLAAKAALAKLPHETANFVYCQVKGTCKRFGVPEEPQRVTLLGGVNLSLDLSDGMQRNMYYLGFLEPRYLKCLSRYVSPGNVFVDVGANVGYYSVWAAKRVEEQGRVFCFEPNPIAFGHLKGNVALNHFGNVTLHNVALGETDAAGGLTLCVGRTGGSHLTLNTSHPDGVVTVPIKTLDGCLEADGFLARGVDVMKIDAEGAETAICKGASAVLTHSRPYLMTEVDDGLLKRLGSSARELLDSLHQREYQPYHVLRDGGLKPFDLGGNPPGHCNLFFVPKGKPLL